MSCKNEEEKLEVSENPASIELSSVKLQGLDGNVINMAEFNGNAVFLNFWATWCKPCIKEMPSIQAAIKQMNDDKIVFLFASTETMEEIEAFKNNNGFDFQYVQYNNPEELGIMALPTTFIFNPFGELVFNEMGYRNWEDEKNIQLLKNIVK